MGQRTEEEAMVASMHGLREEYLDILRSLSGDVTGRERAVGAIKASDIRAYGRPVEFSYVPYVFAPQDVAFLEEVCARTHGLLSKVIARYLEDEGYRRLFGFSEELERLILLPCPYAEKLPMARFDVFLDDRDMSFKFCEFNTDGSGAMSRDAECGRALMEGGTLQRFSALHPIQQFDLFDSWVAAFMETYRSCGCFPDDPTVAITDFEESGVMSDFTRFLAAFERAGIQARFVDVRSFTYDGKQLRDPSDGAVIHAVYRRAVTSEMLQHPGECDAFIDATADMNVCTIGHFRTTVVHSKMVSVVLHDPATADFLDEEERAFIQAHVPRTYRLRAEEAQLIEEVRAEKDLWIIKPEDDYGAHGVFAGIDHSPESWSRIVDERLDAGCIVQEYYLPRTVPLVPARVPVDGEALRVEDWHTMPGLYAYNGRFAGVYSREGREGVIALDHGGLVSPSFRVTG